MTELADDAQVAGSENTPSGPLTFLIADVRGYTRFTFECGDTAAAQLAERFAALCEETVARHAGKVIELRGDEALGVFPSARNALRAAVALQEAFRQVMADDPSLPLKVGMGLDAGEPIPIRGGYRGGALNLAARLCSIAGGGEVLASETVIGLARKTDGLAFIDRGEVSLKGIVTPVRVLQIAPEGELPNVLPPLQSILVTHPTNLPDDPTPFIGREDEINRIGALLQQTGVRLVTLTGTGGTGKTRLALQVGNTLLYSFRDGVFFISLVPLSDPDLVPASIADVLGIKKETGTSLIETIETSLADKHLLLVLDNFEHLLNAVSVVARLLDNCRELHILVTSRIPLHLSREHEHAVPPLALPPATAAIDPETLSQYESVAFFIERAGAAKSSFTVTNENAPAVAEICARLDGLPLAIELAAARIKLFPPSALLQRLDGRLRLLTGGARDRPSRQQTLRGAIDWSYSLLTPGEQTLFARLAVFAGGCTFEAAEAVCNQAGDLDLLDDMTSLVDKSLLRQDGENEPRFTMLETIREFAVETLADRGEEDTIRAAHASYCVGLTEEAEAELRGPEQLTWMGRLDAEVPNLWAAVRYLLDNNRQADALQILSLYDYWIFRVGGLEALRLLEGCIEQMDESVPVAVRGKALWAFASIWMWIRLGGPETARPIAYLEQALPLLQAAGESLIYVRALNSLGNAHRFLGDRRRAIELYEQALTLVRASGQQRQVGVLLQNLALLSMDQGDDETAMGYFVEGESILRASGDGNVLAMHLFHLGECHVLRGELDLAHVRLGECRPMFETLGRPAWIGLSDHALGVLALKEGEDERAAQYLDQALRQFWRNDNEDYAVEALGSVGALELERGHVETAGRLLGAMVHLRRDLTVTPIHLLSREHEETMRRIRAVLDDETWDRVQQEGGTMNLDDAVTYALDLTESS